MRASLPACSHPYTTALVELGLLTDVPERGRVPNMSHRLHNTHMPCQSPPEFSKLYGFKDKFQNTFYGMVSTVESTVKNVTSALHSSGLWNSSLFIWATDNGSPVSAGSNHPLRESFTFSLLCHACHSSLLNS